MYVAQGLGCGGMSVAALGAFEPLEFLLLRPLVLLRNDETHAQSSLVYGCSSTVRFARYDSTECFSPRIPCPEPAEAGGPVPVGMEPQSQCAIQFRPEPFVGEAVEG